MSRVILDRRQLVLEYTTDCLVIREPDQAPRSLPLSRITQLICMHSVQITTQLVGQLLKRGIDFIVVNQRHTDNSFSLYADHVQQAHRRSVQYNWQSHAAARLEWSRYLVSHKLKVTANVLNSHSANARTLADSMTAVSHRVLSATNEATLRGWEGNAQKALFNFWRQQLPISLGFQQRQRRPPPDPVNATLSLSYMLAYEEGVRQIKQAGLDPDLGCYHRLASGRKSLACDLMEPLRPRIEAWVVELFSEKILNGRHFSPPSKRGCWLGKGGRETYYAHIDDVQRQWRRYLAGYARILARTIDRHTLPEEYS
ncbi:CRISPR-associated endonuclease Cas1 [Halomonas sp. KRD171]|uniref:CRISPR-associated endonuclease Cas1 n=1 Tax=Halomonas sp. KRD171 TaxID=2729726 RepID=UPI0019D1ED6B|nr:CRISPR-associated endonuclease Cas1 [Halomonas sp. KRD171]